MGIEKGSGHIRNQNLFCYSFDCINGQQKKHFVLGKLSFRFVFREHFVLRSITAMLLFAGYIDAATSMSESCGGGGGSTPESDWGKKDDEDERMFARRCLLMAHSMYKPKSVKRGFHR